MPVAAQRGVRGKKSSVLERSGKVARSREKISGDGPETSETRRSGIGSNSPRAQVGFRLGRRLPADRLAGNPRYRRRRSSAMYRYARGAPGLREVPSAGLSLPSPPLLGVWPRLPLALPYPAALPRNTETSSGGLDCPAGEPWCSAACAASLGEPRLASSRSTAPRQASPSWAEPSLACSRPRRASVSYIAALAFVLIISNGAAARERNTSIADARSYYARRNTSLSHVHALRVSYRRNWF